MSRTASELLLPLGLLSPLPDPPEPVSPALPVPAFAGEQICSGSSQGLVLSRREEGKKRRREGKQVLLGMWKALVLSSQ